MIIKICRHAHGLDSIFSAIFIDSHYECCGLENTKLCISPGKYEAFVRLSPNKGYEVIELKNVPENGKEGLIPDANDTRDNIQIHIGNYYHQLIGCIAPGTNYDEHMVINSKVAFDKIMIKAKQADKLFVHIVETEQ